MIAHRSVVFGALLALAGCGLFGRVEPPIADCGKRVLDDAAKGMSITEIVADVATPCGMDAAAVIAALLASNAPEVVGTKAYLEARRAQVAK